MIGIERVPVIVWILASGAAMSLISLAGAATLLLSETATRRLVLPLVAFAAGALIGGAFFHMLPEAVVEGGNLLFAHGLAVLGFLVFFVVEQLLHYHHCHRAAAECREPFTYLVMIGDGLHNFLDGLAVAGSFLVDVRLGLTTTLAIAAHEVPQELGDFAVLVHGGWPTRQALLWNLAWSLTFVVGSLTAYFASFRVDVGWIVPFAAGNFLYVGASDLVPQVNKHRDARTNVLLLASFTAGLALLLVVHLQGAH